MDAEARDRVAVVTGAGRGLGRRRRRRARASVAIRSWASHASGRQLAETADRIRAAGGRMLSPRRGRRDPARGRGPRGLRP